MIDGSILIGPSNKTTSETFAAIDPSTGEPVGPLFSTAAAADVDAACALADAAFPLYAATAPEQRATLLEVIADAIVAIGDPLIECAIRETGLPQARLEGERGRTIGQLRLFAAVLRSGDYLDATIDPAMADRKPVPRADLRRVNIPLGPVAVFGASNFPLAFSVAGGDTASALAAGCPVVVKGHPAHPGTGELVARAIRSAIEACDIPAGIFSFLPGPAIELGASLVADPRIKAVGFTGSRAGGLALVDIAARRREPIPVYAEMSSINPVLLLPAALEARADALAEGFVQSVNTGAGQFCTNPGLLIGIAGEHLDRFGAAASTAMAAAVPATMLTPAVHSAFAAGVAAFEAHPAVEVVAHGPNCSGLHQARPALFATDAATFLADPVLSAEVFGATSLLVRCADAEELMAFVTKLEGQLTATLMIDEGDLALAAALMPILARKAGRILANGWPTGVEVGHAMVHGGPYPATSDSRTSSVGSLAIARFVRPVCFQDIPDALLPPALRADNPWSLARRIEGVPVIA